MSDYEYWRMVDSHLDPEDQRFQVELKVSYEQVVTAPNADQAGAEVEENIGQHLFEFLKVAKEFGWAEVSVTATPITREE